MEENMNNEMDMGIVKISDEVIGVIAGLATTEIKGVVGMSAGPVGGITQILTGKKNLSKGVKVTVGENNATIDLYIVIEYGIRIPDVALKVQENVRRAVESMTGLTVAAVNIHVQNVLIPKSEENNVAELEE
ncbi:putative alkaline shock family protein YloU [Clostridium tetanomorphum]|uniref:Asp23/Gls24 family envelope stress response protein n=1 Tax=Clostridium tetanomorphum TaxID=1553 RepID=A0A923EA25_CLOTT|nr:Asp23/Gls24 family envelope stress response protein [Clostridium tetanomorphum]KAJ51480.1 alkaline shock protein [Clostridium tetanomorphum DSM 665]MBC2396573.1 Asp23/Gls24 family envelope stress response protein [Clostridium tetanomorphum]MBP1863901.1 putative alkaline shock family protein YloU [Clostridium tetanomorphum]NRS84979.1 putative alkaline shock family protein YloU [Clostridium tetanomorphum]NRZ98195.1 putative alkaline shock family protein YloU [Clostridium tetanomorphum]